MTTNIDFGTIEFESKDQSIFFEKSGDIIDFLPPDSILQISVSGSGIEIKLGGTVDIPIDIDLDLGFAQLAADIDAKIGLELGMFASGGSIDSSFFYDLDFDFASALRGTAGETIQYMAGTGDLADIAFKSTPVKLGSYICPSSGDLGHERLISKGGSGSLGFQSKPRAGGAASGVSRWSFV